MSPAGVGHKRRLIQTPGGQGFSGQHVRLCFLDEKNWQEAKTWFVECLKADTRYAPAHYNLGLVYRSLGRRKDAVRSFKSYLDLSPNADDTRQVQRWIRKLTGF